MILLKIGSDSNHLKKQLLENQGVINLEVVAVWTGLEPATPCVTGMYSNQLNYQTVSQQCCCSFAAVRKDKNFIPSSATLLRHIQKKVAVAFKEKTGRQLNPLKIKGKVRHTAYENSLLATPHSR